MKNLSILFTIIFLSISSHAVETGALCTIDDDCPVLHNCLETAPNLYTCVHKPLFPITAREVIATLVTVTLNAFLTAGGVGAGAAFVPYVILLFRTTLSHAIYIAYLVVFGGGVGNLLNIIGLKNPKTNRFMTNYNLNMIILPALMTGVMIGMILQRIFPPLVTHLILLMTLAYALYKNYGKLKMNLAKERKERQAKKDALKIEEMTRINPSTTEVITQAPERISNESEPEKESAKDPSQETPIVSSEKPDEVVTEGVKETPQETIQGQAQRAQESGQELAQQSVQELVQEVKESEIAEKKSPSADKLEDMTMATNIPADKGSSRALNVIVKPSEINLAQLQEIEAVKEKDIPKDPLEEKRKLIYAREQRYPFRKIAEISVNVVIIILIGLIRGSKKFKPIVGVDWTCGWDFIWFGVAIAAYSLVLFRALYLVLKWQKEKLEVGYEFLPEEPLMTRPKIIRLVIVATIAGTIGAIVALGGSMIVGPTLLDFGMPPAFSAATTGFFMIFAMFNTTFSAILNQKVSNQELAWLLPLAFVFSFISSKLVNWYVKKTGKQSTIIKCIMLVAALGFVCLLAIMILGLVEDTQAQITFTSVC